MQQTRVGGITREQNIICRQLFAGHEVGSRPMKLNASNDVIGAISVAVATDMAFKASLTLRIDKQPNLCTSLLFLLNSSIFRY